MTWRANRRAARSRWPDGKLRVRLARHHRDPVATFEGWSSQWLAPGFRNWSILPLLRRSTCRSSRSRARNDGYGSMRQIDEIANYSRGPVELQKLADCGHDPFRDAPRRMLDLCAAFVSRVCKTA